MPSQRRVKAFGLIILLTILITLYMTSSPHSTRDSQFYKKTSSALQAQKVEVEKLEVEDIGARLKAAEDAAKAAADKKGHQLQEEVQEEVEAEEAESEGKSVAGRVKIQSEKEKDERVVELKGAEEEKPIKAKQEPETREDHEVEVELNEILKKSPMIIFSKTFCPFSRKAKAILLHQYKINPPPYVVELDEHPLGVALQAALGKQTGRKTVPNVLINGKSIGGGDDVEALHQSNKLAAMIKNMGGKRMMEVSKIEVKTKEEVKR